MRSGKLITRLDRYIFRQLAFALIAVTGGLTALVWLIQSLRFVELVVNHGLSLVVFVELTGLLIPSFIAVILPITTFVVVQFVYQRLAGDREITVMRAAGLSPFALSRPALALAVLAVDRWLRIDPVDRARQLYFVPPVPVGDPQSHGCLPAAGRRVHACLGRPDRLCPFARSRRHAARHPGRRWTRQERTCHDPGRKWPADGGAERSARVAGERQPPGNRSSDRPAQRADVRPERDRPHRQPGDFQ